MKRFVGSDHALRFFLEVVPKFAELTVVDDPEDLGTVLVVVPEPDERRRVEAVDEGVDLVLHVAAVPADFHDGLRTFFCRHAIGDTGQERLDAGIELGVGRLQ